MQVWVLLFFFLKQVGVTSLWWWVVKEFAELGTYNLKKSDNYLGPSPMRPNELWTRAHNVPGAVRAQATVVNVVVVGLFEEEGERISIAEEKIKVTFTTKAPTKIEPTRLPH